MLQGPGPVSPPPPPPPPPPKPKPVDASQQSANAAAALGARTSPDHAGGFLGGLVDNVNQLANRLATKPIDTQEAGHDLARLQDDFKAAKTPQDVQALATRADELQGRAMVSQGQQLPPELQQQITTMRDRAEAASQAVGQLHDDHATLAGAADGPARSALAAHLLANPGELQNNLAALGPLAGSPLMGRAKDWAGGIQKLATPEALGQQLAKAPDLAHYPPGLAADLGKLRDLPNPSLQRGLDAVGQNLLAQSQVASASGGTQADPLSYDAVKANPGLGRLIAPMQASKDPAVRAQVQQLAQGWSEKALQQNLDANRHGAPTDPNANARNTLDGYQRDIQDLAAKTGLGPALQAAGPDALKAAAVSVLNRKDVNFDAMKQNPAYGQLLAQLKDDPAYKAQVGAKMREIIGQGVVEHMQHEKKDKGVKDGMGKLKDDLVAMAKSTGLGAEIGEQVQPAINDHHQAIKDAENRGKGFFDHLSDFATGAFNDLAKGIAEPFKLLGSGEASILNAVGLHGLAKDAQQFNNGIGDGLGGTVSGFGMMVAHPMAAAKNLGGMLLHPSRIEAAGKAIFDEAMKGGVAHGLGYAVGALAPTLLGGSAAGLIGKGVDALAASDIPVLSTAAARAGELGGLGLKTVAIAKGAFNQDIGKLVDAVGTESVKTADIAKVAEVGDHTFASGAKTIAQTTSDTLKGAGQQLKGVAAAEDRSAAAGALLKDTLGKAKDKVVATDSFQQKLVTLKAIRTPGKTARELVDGVKTVKASLVEGKDILTTGKGLKEGAKLTDRAIGAADHVITDVGKVVDSDLGKIGNTIANTVGVAVNPIGFFHSKLPGAIIQNKLLNRAYRKLNVQAQAHIDQANQLINQGELMSALDLRDALGGVIR